jgi:hypothetical protein
MLYMKKGPELVIYQPKEIMDSMNGNIYKYIQYTR